MLEVILVAVLCFCLRSVLAFRNKWVGIDTLGYMAYSLAIKETGNMVATPKRLRIKKDIDFFIPQLFCVVLSWFPKKHYDKLRFLSPAIDTLTAVILYFFTYDVVGPTAALVAALIYTFSPIIFYSSITTNPRALSNLIFTLGMLSLYYYFATGNYWLLLPFFITNLINLPMHRMTIQTTVAVVLVESIVFMDILPALTFIASVIVMWFGTKDYKDIAKDHVRKLASYATHGGFRTGKLVPENPFRIFSAVPFMGAIFIWYLISGMIGMAFLETWFLTLLILSFIWVLGDGFRYMTNAVFPISVLAAAMLVNSGTLMGSVLIAITFFTMSLIGIWKVIRSYEGTHRVMDTDAIECFKWLGKNAKQSDVLVSLPFEYHYSLVAIFFSGINSVGGDYTEKEVMEKGSAAGYKIDWVVTNNGKFKKLPRFKEKYKSGKFYVFKKVK